MFVFLSGTHDNGKTTLAFGLARELKKRGHDVRVIQEIARTVHEQGYTLNEHVSISTQARIACLSFLKMQENIAEITICDRGVDFLAYSRYGVEKGRILPEEHEALRGIARLIVKMFDPVIAFFPPIEWEIHPDGVRATSPEFRKKIHELMVEEFKEFTLHFIEPPNREEKLLRLVLDAYQEQDD